MRWYFVVHYSYFLLGVGLAIDAQLRELAADQLLAARLVKVREEALEGIIRDKGSRALNSVAELISTALGPARVSILEIVGGSHKFLGFAGSFKDTEGLTELSLSSPVREAVVSGDAVIGWSQVRTPEFVTGSKKTQYAILPLRHKHEVVGTLCLTNFSTGSMMPFVAARLGRVQLEAELLMSLLLSERQNRAKATLIEVTRLRTHRLLSKSEEYFLAHFRISDALTEPAFIAGDLADSTPLRRQFGERVRVAQDNQLEYIFERFKHHGIIVNRDKGDFLSVTIPNQARDSDRLSSLRKAYEILTFLANPDLEFLSIPRAAGILTPFQYKFVCSQVSVPLRTPTDTGVVPSLGLLTDSEMDLASRVIDKVAYAGECILLERAWSQIPIDASIIEIAPHRVKGIERAPRVFSVRPKSGKAQSA
jgi:hypothetical protein